VKLNKKQVAEMGPYNQVTIVIVLGNVAPEQNSCHGYHVTQITRLHHSKAMMRFQASLAGMIDRQ